LGGSPKNYPTNLWVMGSTPIRSNAIAQSG